MFGGQFISITVAVAILALGTVLGSKQEVSLSGDTSPIALRTVPTATNPYIPPVSGIIFIEHLSGLTSQARRDVKDLLKYASIANIPTIRSASWVAESRFPLDSQRNFHWMVFGGLLDACIIRQIREIMQNISKGPPQSVTRITLPLNAIAVGGYPEESVKFRLPEYLLRDFIRRCDLEIETKIEENEPEKRFLGRAIPYVFTAQSLSMVYHEGKFRWMMSLYDMALTILKDGKELCCVNPVGQRSVVFNFITEQKNMLRLLQQRGSLSPAVLLIMAVSLVAMFALAVIAILVNPSLANAAEIVPVAAAVTPPQVFEPMFGSSLFGPVLLLLGLVGGAQQRLDALSNFSLGEESRAYRDWLRELLHEVLSDDVVAEMDRTNKFNRETAAKIVGGGFIGNVYPTEYGGSARGMIDALLVMNETSKISPAMALIINVLSCLATYGIYLYGSDGQKERFLSKILKGEMFGAFALTEPKAGSDTNSMQANFREEADDEGKIIGYILNGEKEFITCGAVAGYALVFARRDGGDNKTISAFIVPLDLKGVEVTSTEPIGMRGTGTARLHFKNVAVPKENLLGEINQGHKIMSDILRQGRVIISGIGLGIMEASLIEAIEAYRKDSFGKDFSKIVDMLWHLQAARLLIMEAVRAKELFDREEESFRERATLLATLAKLAATEFAVKSVSDAMDIVGMESVLSGSRLQMFLRDARLLTIGEGTSQMMVRVAASLLDLASEPVSDKEKDRDWLEVWWESYILLKDLEDAHLTPAQMAVKDSLSGGRACFLNLGASCQVVALKEIARGNLSEALALADSAAEGSEFRKLAALAIALGIMEKSAGESIASHLKAISESEEGRYPFYQTHTIIEMLVDCHTLKLMLLEAAKKLERGYKVDLESALMHSRITHIFNAQTLSKKDRATIIELMKGKSLIELQITIAEELGLPLPEADILPSGLAGLFGKSSRMRFKDTRFGDEGPKQGDRIFHGRFGEGIVIEIRMDDHYGLTLKIDFAGQTKWLAWKLAKDEVRSSPVATHTSEDEPEHQAIPVSTLRPESLDSSSGDPGRDRLEALLIAYDGFQRPISRLLRVTEKTLSDWVWQHGLQKRAARLRKLHHRTSVMHPGKKRLASLIITYKGNVREITRALNREGINVDEATVGVWVRQDPELKELAAEQRERRPRQPRKPFNEEEFRKQVIKLVRERPGINLDEIARVTGVYGSTVGDKVRVFESLGLVELVGMSKEIRVFLKGQTPEIVLTADQQKILDFIMAHPGLPLRKIAQETSISESVANRTVRILESKGLVRRVGVRRNNAVTVYPKGIKPEGSASK